MSKPTACEIMAAVDREVGRQAARASGPGTWDVDLDGMTQDEVAAYAERLVEDLLLPTDPPLVWRPYVDRSVVLARSEAKPDGGGHKEDFADFLLSCPLEDVDLCR